jgi:hypothetical protein
MDQTERMEDKREFLNPSTTRPHRFACLVIARMPSISFTSDVQAVSGFASSPYSIWNRIEGIERMDQF